jgi:hypothetical protein
MSKPVVSKQESQKVSGQFTTYFKENGEMKEYVVSHPTQEELADGWNLVVPKVRKDSTQHHFSIYLSQLPSQYWRFLSMGVDNEGREYYKDIKDGIYTYSIKMSKYDNEIKELYNHLQKVNYDSRKLKKQYEKLLMNRVKGWVMIRARELLNDNN